MYKKNLPERIGELAPGKKERTRRENRLLGTFLVALTFLAGYQAKDTVNDSRKTERTCVTTDGSATVWGNAVKVQNQLVDRGVRIPDTREVSDKMDTNGPVLACGDVRKGIISKAMGLLPFANADIDVTPITAEQDQSSSRLINNQNS